MPQPNPKPQRSLEPLRIVELTIENVKRIRAATIYPKGDAVVIAGANAAGKSSVMDSLAYALGGKELVPAKPIRRGAKSGKVVVDLEKYRVERRFTEKGSQLYVTGKEGEIFRSPQALLDELVGDLTFDPGEFLLMKSDARVSMLRQLVGIDTAELDREYTAKFEERKVVNREVSSLRGAVSQMTKFDDAPVKEIELGDLAQRLQEATQHNKAITDIRDEITKMEELRTATNGHIEIYREALGFFSSKPLCEAERIGAEFGCDLFIRFDGETLTRAEHLEGVDQLLSTATSSAANLDHSLAGLREQLDLYIGEHGDMSDTDALLQEHKESEELNKKIRANIAYREKHDALTARESEAKQLTTRLDAIWQEKRDMIASAEFPVPGLSFDDVDGVTFNGVPFEQASSAEQVRVSFGMAVAMNQDKRLRICLIRHGAFLDTSNLALIEQMAAESGCQVWIERVGGDGDATVIIEDGTVVGQEVQS